jgi:hypothetical protein
MNINNIDELDEMRTASILSDRLQTFTYKDKMLGAFKGFILPLPVVNALALWNLCGNVIYRTLLDSYKDELDQFNKARFEEYGYKENGIDLIIHTFHNMQCSDSGIDKLDYFLNNQ